MLKLFTHSLPHNFSQHIIPVGRSKYEQKAAADEDDSSKLHVTKFHLVEHDVICCKKYTCHFHSILSLAIPADAGTAAISPHVMKLSYVMMMLKLASRFATVNSKVLEKTLLLIWELEQHSKRRKPIYRWILQKIYT